MVFKHTQVPERRQGLHPVHDGGRAVRPVADRLPRLLVAPAQGLQQQRGLEVRSEARALPRRRRRPVLDGYKGPITQAAGAVTAEYIVVQMCASVASGQATPEEAAKEAERRARRYYPLTEHGAPRGGRRRSPARHRRDRAMTAADSPTGRVPEPARLARRGCSTGSRSWSSSACCRRSGCCWCS